AAAKMTIGDSPMTSLQTTIDRRTALKLIGAVGAWQTLAPTIGAAQADVRPFRIHVADEELGDLRRRLANIRWPPDATGKPWSMGTDLAYMKQLVTYWKDRYNWRKQEADLNKFDHYTTVIDGYKIHFIQQKSRNLSAMPIVMSHGYPGTIWE